MGRTDFRLKQIIEYILEDADSSLADYEKEKNQVIYGELIAYSSALKSIKSMMDEEEYATYKLDFDIDAKYL